MFTFCSPICASSSIVVVVMCMKSKSPDDAIRMYMRISTIGASCINYAVGGFVWMGEELLCSFLPSLRLAFCTHDISRRRQAYNAHSRGNYTMLMLSRSLSPLFPIHRAPCESAHDLHLDLVTVSDERSIASSPPTSQYIFLAILPSGGSLYSRAACVYAPLRLHDSSSNASITRSQHRLQKKEPSRAKLIQKGSTRKLRKFPQILAIFTAVSACRSSPIRQQQSALRYWKWNLFEFRTQMRCDDEMMFLVMFLLFSRGLLKIVLCASLIMISWKPKITPKTLHLLAPA